MKILLVVTHVKKAQQAVTWLVESVRRQDSQLLVANCVLNPVAVPGRVAAWPLIEKPQNVHDAIKEAINRLPDDNVNLLSEITGEFPDREIADIIKNQNIDILYFPIDAEQNPGKPDMQFGQQLLRDAPCDVILMDLGASSRSLIERLVVPMDLSASGHVIRHIIKRGSKIGHLVPLHISPDFGGDSQKIAASELDMQLREIGIKEPLPWIEPLVVMADSFHQGLLQTVKANDAIVLSGTSIKMIHDLRLQLQQIRPHIADAVPIGVYRPAELAAKTGFGRIKRRLKVAMPELTLADRISLFDRIQGGARVTPDFISMIGLSVLMASFGLLADNTSVVIGAMLVAPFMTPLIGVGLAIAQGNLALIKRSGIATGTGLLVGISISLILGLLIPIDELPLEVLARGDPNLVDLAIAFVSGMAAAYAVSRESVAESIVGVAIAAALVPPLACVGIMLGNGYILEAEGALTLLVTNLAAIALGAAFIFRRLGVPGTRTGHRSYVKIRWISLSLILLLLLLAIPLGYRMAKQLAVGQTRPVNFRVSSTVKRIVNERIDQIDGMEVVFLGRSGSGHSKLIRILLAAEKPIPQSVVDDIKAELRETLGEDTPIIVRVFQNAVITKKEQQVNEPIMNNGSITKKEERMN